MKTLCTIATAGVLATVMALAAPGARGDTAREASINDIRPHNPLLPLHIYVPDVEARVQAV